MRSRPVAGPFGVEIVLRGVVSLRADGVDATTGVLLDISLLTATLAVEGVPVVDCRTNLRDRQRGSRSLGVCAGSDLGDVMVVAAGDLGYTDDSGGGHAIFPFLPFASEGRVDCPCAGRADIPARITDLLAFACAVLGGTDELVALPRLGCGRQAVTLHAGHLLTRVAPSGADHVKLPGRRCWRSGFAGGAFGCHDGNLLARETVSAGISFTGNPGADCCRSYSDPPISNALLCDSVGCIASTLFPVGDPKIFRGPSSGRIHVAGQDGAGRDPNVARAIRATEVRERRAKSAALLKLFRSRSVNTSTDHRRSACSPTYRGRPSQRRSRTPARPGRSHGRR